MIYLDNAATTRPSEYALEKANGFLADKWFNPSALYRGGEEVKKLLKGTRESLLALIGEPYSHELVFTSCGTEADNIAVFCGGRRGNVVTTAGEHAAVYESCKELKNRGVEPRFASLNADGSVDADALLSLVDDNTSLVSVVHVNSETGAVNDIAEIGKKVKRKNPRTLFHSDGVQAFGKIPVRLTKEIDLYSVSAHKIGGLKGTGGLFKSKTVRNFVGLYGGGQESGYRSGTENAFGIACFAYAAEEKFRTMEEDGKRLRRLRERLWALLDKELFVRLSPETGTPYILTVSAKGLRGAVLQQILSDREIYVGTGSACSSKKPFSRVIEACGYGRDILYGVLRMSFSPETNEAEIVRAAEAINVAARDLKGRL